MHALGPQRIHRDRSNERRVDAARQSQHHTRKPVLVDVVAQAQHAGVIGCRVPFLEHSLRPRLAAPAGCCLLPLGDDQCFFPRRELHGEARVGIENERRAVEHQLVLSSDLVEIGQRDTRLGDARGDDVEAHVRLLPVERRAVRHEENFRAAFIEAFAHLLLPDVLADRHADLDTAEIDRPRQRTGVEHALLVEHAIVRQIDLVAHRRDAAAVDQRHRVVDLVLVRPHTANDHRRPGLKLMRQGFNRCARGRSEGRLAHEVLGRIAANVQLGIEDQVGAFRSRACARLLQPLRVAGDIAQHRVELCKRNFQMGCIGHGRILGLPSHLTQRASCMPDLK